MKKTIFTVMLACLGAMFTACGSKQKAEVEENAEEVQQPRILVLYYSQTGTTKALAEELQIQLGADIEAVECEVPYDGDFNQTIQRCQEEMADNEVPAVKSLNSNIGDYDIIFLGYPVWFGTYAQPIGGLLHSQSFEGKKIVTFCTFGSGGLESSTKALAEALPESEVVAGYGVRTARIEAAPEEVNRWLIETGFKEGNVDPLPAFMEHHPVSKDEAAIFHAACDGYQMPLGSPVDVAVRETDSSTDYEFTAKTPEGNSTIYVTQSKADGAKPEFTKVVRP